MSIPDFLIDRYKDWKDNIFSNKNKFYQKLQKNGQSPKAMIITCCDSRINLEALFKIKEGEFFSFLGPSPIDFDKELHFFIKSE